MHGEDKSNRHRQKKADERHRDAMHPSLKKSVVLYTVKIRDYSRQHDQRRSKNADSPNQCTG